MKRKISAIALALSLALLPGCSSFSPKDTGILGNLSNRPVAPAATTAPSSEAYSNHEPYYYSEPTDYSEGWWYMPFENTEEYATAAESPFKDVATSPLSTFSADVDTASYSNMRRQIRQGMEPVGIRIEELVN